MPAESFFIGHKFSRLIVIGEARKINPPRWLMWWCRCDCGSEKLIRSIDVLTGKTKSCGCWNRDVTTQRNLIHGYSFRGKRSPAYSIWAQIIQRCRNPNASNFSYYGGRGITVCSRWESFTNFIADMGERPDGMAIDRIDNEGPYCKENCRWISHAENCKNTRAVHLLTVDGQTMCISDWAKLIGVTRPTLSGRVFSGSNYEEFIRNRLASLRVRIEPQPPPAQ